MNSKNIGRLLIFKYLGITIFILVVSIFLSTFASIELKTLIEHHIINPYINDLTYFSIQIIIDSFIVFFIAGNIGKLILEENTDPFWTTFFGFLKMWIGFLCVAMFSEIILKLTKYRIDFKMMGLGVLIWLFMGGPIFMIIGSIQGGLTSWFVGKEIESKKNTLN